MTKSYRFRLAFPIALLLAAFTVSCGGDVTLPDEGEAADLRIVDGNDQVGAAGAKLGKPVIVRVLDSDGRPVPSQDVDFVVQGGGSVDPETFTTGADGLATANWTLGPGAGAQQLQARTPRGGGTDLLQVQFTATAVAGQGSVLTEVQGDEQRGPVNSALADSLVVKTTDALGNPVANVEVTWSVSGGGSISPVTVLTDAEGLAAAERVLGPTAGPQSAQATVDASFTGSPVTFTHTAEPANPTALVLIDGDDQSAPAGFEVPKDLQVRLQDPNGNGIGGRAITWVVPAGAGSVTQVSVETDPNGFATTRWTLPNAVGNYTVSAVFSGLPPVVFSATATSDAPTTIEMVSGNGQSAAVGTAVTNPLVVRVTDANDNPVANVAVAWTAVNGGSVSADNSATNAQGLAQVSRTLGLAPGQYTTTAAVDGLQGSPVTFVSTATVGAPTQLAITQQPGGSTVSGNQFEPPPIIQVQDAQGNPVAQGGIPIVVTITSGQVGATLENESRNTNLSGRVTFSTLRISGPPDDDYILTFTANFAGSPLTPVSTGPLTVTAGGATRLVLTQQPSATAQSGVQFAQAPVVQVVDATGNPVAGNRTIEVEIGDGGGTLEGDATVSTNGGSTATFSDLAISGTIGSRTLLFSSGALTPVESNLINLTTGPAASMSIQAGNNQDAQVGTTLPTDPAVIIRDSGGNPVGGVEVTFEVTGGGGSVTPNPVSTGSNGIAATNWTLGPAAGANQLQATSSVGQVTFNATGTELGTTTSLSVEPPAPTTSGTLVTFTATVASGGGTPTGTVSFRDGGTEIGTGTLNGAGVATFQTSALTVEQHTFTAHYVGEGAFGASDSDPVVYDVTASNVAPVANPDNFSVNEDGTLSRPAPGVLANDTDGNGDGLTAQQMGQPPANGDLAFSTNGSFTYSPDPDFNGSDQFSYRASDGQASSATVTVTLTVNAVNDDPVFTPGGDITVNTVEALTFSDQWATGIDPGPPDESSQALSFAVTLVNPADADAFLVPPQISDDGTLTFAAAQLSLTESRVIPLSVVLTDDQGGNAGPVGLSLTIAPVGP